MLDISFILLADGPHGSASLKPDHSHQWWARRDSLVRCSALAGSASVCILFSPQSSPGVYSALCMTGKLREEMPIPNERELLIRWKQATLLAEEGRAEKLLSVERTSNIVASMNPSLEVEGGPRSFPLSHNMDKRAQLRTLQEQAPIEFLRKHGLNGSEASVLKKRNRASIEGACLAWSEQLRQSSSSSYSGKKSQLHLSFEVLFRRLWYEKKGYSRLTLLLLHEDMPQELGVFGDNCDPGSEGEKGHLVICVLGAVRDMYVQEETALLAAFYSFGQTLSDEGVMTSVKGVNLGRTPEFTSKIISVMCFHSQQGRLGKALDRVKEIPMSAVVHVGEGIEPSSKRHKPESGLMKLPPQQTVSRTLPFPGNGSAYLLDSSSAPKESALPRPVHLHFIMRCKGGFELIKGAIPKQGPKLGPDSAKARTAVFPLVQAVVMALWRSRISGETQKNDFGSSSCPSSSSWLPINTLHILDPTGGVLTLKQNAVIAMMADSHRAAPCEGQVLATLQSCLEKGDLQGYREEEEVARAILAGEEGSKTKWGERVEKTEEKKEKTKKKRGKGVVVRSLQVPAVLTKAYSVPVTYELTKEREKEKKEKKEKKGKKRKVVVVFLEEGVHSRATQICMLQHLAYCDRLVPALKAAL